MAAVFPGGQNSFIKDHKSSNSLVVDFSRNTADFPLNRYCQIQPVTKTTGYYLRMTVEEAGRILEADLANHSWEDGTPRPERNEGTESFEYLDYQTRRYDYGFMLGDKAVDQASFNLTETHSRIKAQQAMTGRTQLAVTELTTAANFDSSHVAAVAAISGNTGNWGQSTTQRQDIRRSFHYGANIIKKDTLGVTKTNEMQMVFSPDVAIEISETQEIVDHVKGSPDAMAQIKGDAEGHNKEWNLPNQLYGVEVVIEDTVKTTSNKGATVAKSYVMGSGFAALTSRPGDLVSPGEGPSFSTLMLFEYENLTVELLQQKDDRRQSGHVVDDIGVEVVAPVSGFLYTTPV